MRYLVFIFGITFVCSVECGPRRKVHCVSPSTKKLYDIGAVWNNGQCVSCECSSLGLWRCKLEICPKLSCRKELQKHTANRCCEFCSGCFNKKTGRVVEEGTTVRSADGCKTWTCESGHLVEINKECPDIFCHETMVVIKDCCQTCLKGCYDTEYGNKRMAENDTFMTPGGTIGGCKTCTCRPSGAIYCKANPCPYLPCPKELYTALAPGQCCPTSCKPGCYDTKHGHVQPGGTYSSSDGCKVCTCNEDRSFDCVSKTCQVPCHRELWLPVKKGQCCPTCKEG